MSRKRRLSSAFGAGFKPRQGGSAATGGKGTGGAPPVAMPGSRRAARSTNVVRPQQRAVKTGLVQNRIQWSAPKTNTSGNSRDGASYREGVDPVTGRKFHMYAAEAGGVPKEIVAVGKLSSRLRRKK